MTEKKQIWLNHDWTGFVFISLFPPLLASFVGGERAYHKLSKLSLMAYFSTKTKNYKAIRTIKNVKIT